MKTYIAIYGNGTKRLFDCFDLADANEIAAAYGTRNDCGMLCRVSIY
jgi:hypothetical protein